MSPPELPASVKALLLRIETYEQLEVVLALARQPERVWALDDVAEDTRLPAEKVQEALEQLTRNGLLSRLPGPGWQLADAKTREVAPQLLAAYRENVLGIIRELTENALERVRTAALRTFADAFVVRRGS